jgi:murein DD-endopeptidase MepM/ murein hydrolase activator NlpD
MKEITVKNNRLNLQLLKQFQYFLFWAFTFFCLAELCSCSVSNNPLRTEIKQLRRGNIKDDTSYVYQLPFNPGTSHFIIQGYFGAFSHKERAALDFKMKKGTEITAARGGVVIRLKEDGDKGGPNRKYRSYGNYIVLQHDDSSRTGYWHLQKDGVLVNIGDSIKKGQVIALSGNTGYSAVPHLHFIAWRYNEKRQWQQMATRIATKRGPRYLRAWHFYRKPKQSPTFD